MTKKFSKDIEKAETWDFGHPEVRKPVKASRVVVSVAFRREDFELVAKYAELLGKKTSEFIRDAAIEKVLIRGSAILASGGGNFVTIWSAADQMPAVTHLAGAQAEHLLEPGLTTY